MILESWAGGGGIAYVPGSCWLSLLIHTISLFTLCPPGYTWPLASPPAMFMPHRCQQLISSVGIQSKIPPLTCRTYKPLINLRASQGHRPLGLAPVFLRLWASSPSLCLSWGCRFPTLVLFHSSSGSLAQSQSLLCFSSHCVPGLGSPPLRV